MTRDSQRHSYERFELSQVSGLLPLHAYTPGREQS